MFWGKQLKFIPDESRFQNLFLIMKNYKKMEWCIYIQCVREFHKCQSKRRNYHPWVMNMTK